MSELRSAIEALRSETLAELPDARLEEDFSELQLAGEQLEAEKLRRLAEIERRGSYRRDGHLSPAAWLAGRFRVAWGHARQQVRMARALEEMDETRRAVEDGEVSMSAARVLVEAREIDPEAFRSVEGALVETARSHSVADLSKVAAYWRQAVEREAAKGGEEELRKHRRLHVSRTFLGLVRVDGTLDPETGATLLAALRAVMDAEARSGAEGDERTPAQKRADALGEVCRGWLDRPERPAVAGERPHVMVTVGAEVLRDHAGQPCEMEGVGPVDPEVARRIGCDASIRRVVIAGPSEPLDVGRKTPVVSSAQRAAVVLRDGHCRFPGCDRPPSWCDVHHVEHWADGGTTSLPNLILLCRPHHRAVHARGGFRLELVDGRPVFTRPDASVLPNADPPAFGRATPPPAVPGHEPGAAVAVGAPP